MKEENYQHESQYPAKISFKGQDKIKMFLDHKKKEEEKRKEAEGWEFITIRSSLKNWNLDLIKGMKNAQSGKYDGEIWVNF